MLCVGLFAGWWHEFLYPHGCFPFRSYPIHLSFDDGPVDNGATETVLNALDQENVVATFFVSGEQLVDETTYLANLQELVIGSNIAGVEIETVSRNIKRSGDYISKRFKLLDRMVTSGHLIASHSFFHVPHNLWSSIIENGEVSQNANKNRGYFRSESAMKRNVSLGKKVLEKYLVSPVNFIRMPFGAGTRSHNMSSNMKNANLSVAQAIGSEGFRHIGLNIDPRDWWLSRLQVHPETGEPLTPELKDRLLINQLLEKICETRGGIVAFHDIEQLTARFIQSWIQKIRRAGHHFVSLEAIAPRCFSPVTLQALRGNIEFHPDGKLKQCWQKR